MTAQALRLGTCRICRDLGPVIYRWGLWVCPTCAPTALAHQIDEDPRDDD
jgi:hypothetical protein